MKYRLFYGLLFFLVIVICGVSLFYKGYSRGWEAHRASIQDAVIGLLRESRENARNVLKRLEEANKEIEKAKQKNENCKIILNYDVRSCFE